MRLLVICNFICNLDIAIKIYLALRLYLITQFLSLFVNNGFASLLCWRIEFVLHSSTWLISTSLKVEKCIEIQSWVRKRNLIKFLLGIRFFLGFTIISFWLMWNKGLAFIFVLSDDDILDQANLRIIQLTNLIHLCFVFALVLPLFQFFTTQRY